mmetsp:Transcript_20630/g.57806  ORF Transcript_20630/g.57806 Transcript_20630/m.57806 type:complete len:299 (-) Transcript_20630:33-929(-)
MFELHPDESGHDDAGAVHLRRQVREGAADAHEDCEQARRNTEVQLPPAGEDDLGLVPRRDEAGHGEALELPEVGRDQRGDQDVAAGPPDDEGEPVVPERVERARQADERRARHPVGCGGHAVEHRRDVLPRDEVLTHVLGVVENTDARVQQQREDNVQDADGPLADTAGLQAAEEHHEQRETARVDAVCYVEASVGAARIRRAPRLTGPGVAVYEALAVGEEENPRDVEHQDELGAQVVAQGEANDTDFVGRLHEQGQDIRYECPDHDRLQDEPLVPRPVVHATEDLHRSRRCRTSRG